MRLYTSLIGSVVPTVLFSINTVGEGAGKGEPGSTLALSYFWADVLKKHFRNVYCKCRKRIAQ
jgi:hypothetical protein